MKFVRTAKVTTFAVLTAMAASGASAESLTAALASAYSNNPDIIAANVSAQNAAEGIVAAKAGTMPSLALSGSVTGTMTSTSGVVSNSTTSRLGLSYSQTLFDSGKTAAEVEAARATADAALQSAKATEQSILLSAAQAYLDVVVNTRIVALRQETVDYLQAQVQAANDRLSVGEGTQTDVAQAQATLASALADQQSAAANLAVSQANYVRYIGHMPSNLSFDFPFESKLPTSLDQALNIAETNHPGLKAAQAQIRSAKADVDAAQANFGPTLTASGSLGGSQTYSDVSSGTSAASASIGVTLSVPLYAGGALGAGVRSANLAQINAEMTAQSTHDMLTATITQAWSSLKSSAVTIAAVAAAENATQRVLDAVTEEFGVGQKTQLDVLDAKSSLTSVQITRITAESGRFTAALTLLSAIGRLSATDLGLPVAVRTPDAYRGKVEDIWQELRAVPN